MATLITVAQAIAYENDPSTIPAGAIFNIVDTAANIESLTVGEINHLQSIGVNAIKSTDGLVKVDPTGAKETAFANANIPITADITVAKALSLESNVASGGTPVLVPPDERITVVGTAAELESLTRSQLKALGTIIDTTASDGTDSGKTAVHKIAGSDAPPVFTAGDMTALGNAHIAVVAPPNDPTQNDGTTVITGRGMTFDITWDSSVASAPAAFQTDVEEVLPVCIKAGALGGNAPRRDLWISPHHAMYFDSASAGGVLIEAKDLGNGISIVQAEHVDRVEYFHIELETHDVIIAEGALSESFIDDDSRGMFHNALEFHALYPQAARNAAQYCAPRREDGYEVEAVRRRIAGFARPGDLALAG